MIRPSSLTDTHSSPVVPVWTEYTDESAGAEYFYCQLASTSNDAIQGNLVFDTGSDTVTLDATSAGVNLVCGIALGAVSAGDYAWFQNVGRDVTVKTNGDDDISAGDRLIPANSASGLCDSSTDSTYKAIGYADADDTDGTNTVTATINID